MRFRDPSAVEILGGLVARLLWMLPMLFRLLRFRSFLDSCRPRKCERWFESWDIEAVSPVTEIVGASIALSGASDVGNELEVVFSALTVFFRDGKPKTLALKLRGVDVPLVFERGEVAVSSGFSGDLKSLV